jgi:Fe-S cluster assembly protein SufD
MNDTIQVNKLNAFIDQLTKTDLPFSKDIIAISDATIASNDFPTTRTEAWKYTRVGKISSIHGNTSELIIDKVSDAHIIDPNALTFVFENGELIQQFSNKEIPKGLEIKSISLASEAELALIGKNVKLENDVFNSLNTSYATDGIFVKVDDKIQLDQAIQIIHIVTGENTISNLRNLIQIGRFSEAKIIFGYFSSEAISSFTNVVTEIFVAENAKLSIDKIQYESAGNFHVSTDQISQEKNSNFSINTITLNGTLVRNNLNIEVDGPNCETHLNGVYLLKENQHVDNHTVVDHKAPHCESHELYKGVIDDKATAVFNGKVFVRKDSQKINAFQSNANVLLSDDASVNSKPELEIYADDVKCSHGSTTGQLNEEAVFYLRARGISEKSARHLMVSAFIEDVISKIENEDVTNFTHSIIKEQFGWEF